MLIVTGGYWQLLAISGSYCRSWAFGSGVDSGRDTSLTDSGTDDGWRMMGGGWIVKFVDTLTYLPTHASINMAQAQPNP